MEMIYEKAAGAFRKAKTKEELERAAKEFAPEVGKADEFIKTWLRKAYTYRMRILDEQEAKRAGKAGAAVSKTFSGNGYYNKRRKA